MSHARSQLVDAGKEFLVILKVHGNGINLWSCDKTHTFSISCQNVENPGQDIKVFVLSDTAATLDNYGFECQQIYGQEIDKQDFVLFMTGPTTNTRKASYAINLALSKSDACCKEKSGSAYLYLDPNFSSQGIQRMPIIAKHNHTPVGQIQVEYLIVTNPVGYGQPAPMPHWLVNKTKLDAGHRGAGSGRRMDLPDELLENTIASFNYAHRHGADYCELDILVSADGIPVVYHDFDVDAVAAQQSSDELGKFKAQVNQFTLKQLREFHQLAMRDGDGCAYTLNVPNQAESNRPFPTLAEVLDQVDKTCGLNIEIKWPQLLENGTMEPRGFREIKDFVNVEKRATDRPTALESCDADSACWPNGKSEATHFREINDFVDLVLDCIFQHGNGRPILLSTLNANIAIMLRLKQTQYPVLFVTTGDSQRFNDPTTKTIKNAIHFAQAFNMAGINPNAAKLNESLVRYAQDRGLLVYAWGEIKSAQRIKELRSIGLNGVICDKIDLIKPQD